MENGKVAQSGRNGPKWSKWPKLGQNGPKWPKWPRVAQMAQSGPNGPEWPKWHICWKIQKPTFFWDALYFTLCILETHLAFLLS